MVSVGEELLSPSVAESRRGRRRSPAPAVARAAAALSLLAADPRAPVGLSELARRLGYPKSSLANIMTELVEAGLARRLGSEFALGRGVAELGGAYLATLDIVQEFRSACNELPTAATETLQLAVLDGLEVIYMARHDGRQMVRFMASDIGRRLPATCTALGKASLATLTSEELEARIAGMTTLPSMTSHSLRTVAGLVADLDQVRRRGFAIDDEETTEGVMCFAVAVPAQRLTGEICAVSATMLKTRVTEAYARMLVEDLSVLARRLDLGGAGM